MSPMFRMTHPNKGNIFIPFPKRIDQNTVKMIHIIPCCKGKEFKVQYIYEASKEQKNLNKDNTLSIDLGIDNLATCVTSLGHSFIMDGRRIKSINHQWNKEMARLRSIAAKQGISTTLRIQKITKKRNNRINDTIKKSARYIINYCIENNIGTLIIGYTANFKSNPTLGKINNQNFVQIPLVHLINQLQFLCWKYDIDCILQEESYTSKSSFLDLDILPIYQNELSCTNTFSGQRIHRGLYQSKKGTLINADVNGSANIMRKCKQNLNYEKLCKGLRASPQRIRVI
ncbi:MAG: transposase [Faecalicoccus sp.]|nr:transposase [Faecalicoccus sp.]